MATLAGFILAAAAVWFLFPVFARVVGALAFYVGLIAATSHESWAGGVALTGALLWLAGHWLHSTKTGYYASHLARVLFEHTPLRWTLWQHWRAVSRRREQRAAVVSHPYGYGER